MKRSTTQQMRLRLSAGIPYATAALLVIAGCGSDNNAFTLASPDIPSNGTIPNLHVFNQFGCTGGNQSPGLQWSNPPAGTQSYVITMYDSDAPTGSGFWHWTVFNVPASARSLARGAGTGGAALPTGAVQGYVDYGTTGYGGPCPPATDTPHHYTFTIYALKVADLGVPSSSTGALVAFNAKSGGNTLGTASFTATYGRGGTQAPAAEPPTATGFTLASNDIPAAGTIPIAQVFNQFGCTGNNTSPEIHWSGVPAGTGRLVLTMYDPDAPNVSGFWHWLVFDIPATASGSIATNAGTTGATPGGGTQGYDDYGFSGYGGPCPPAGAQAHRYVFTLYAIPSSAGTIAAQGASATSTGALIGFITRSLATARATFTATFGR